MRQMTRFEGLISLSYNIISSSNGARPACRYGVMRHSGLKFRTFRLSASRSVDDSALQYWRL